MCEHRPGGDIAAIEERHEHSLTVLWNAIISHLHDGGMKHVSVLQAYRQQCSGRYRLARTRIPDLLGQEGANIFDNQSTWLQFIDRISDDFDKKIPRITAAGISISFQTATAADCTHALTRRAGSEQIGPTTTLLFSPGTHDRRQGGSQVAGNTYRRAMV
jgi:hypothetical protein